MCLSAVLATGVTRRNGGDRRRHLLPTRLIQSVADKAPSAAPSTTLNKSDERRGGHKSSPDQLIMRIKARPAAGEVLSVRGAIDTSAVVARAAFLFWLINKVTDDYSAAARTNNKRSFLI